AEPRQPGIARLAHADPVARAGRRIAVRVGRACGPGPPLRAGAVDDAVAALRPTGRAAPVTRRDVAVVALLERRRSASVDEAVATGREAAVGEAVVLVAVVAVVALLARVDDAVAAVGGRDRVAGGVARRPVRGIALLHAALAESVAAASEPAADDARVVV